jgi:sugar (pentulose or hexulose) kinase
MRRGILGVDLGTSAVKLLLWFEDGERLKICERYDGSPPDCWLAAVKRAVGGLDVSAVAAVGLSSQVGTYIVDGREAVSWRDPVGAAELVELKETFPKQTFINEISMPHPNLSSYPIPRLMYIKKRFGSFKTVCQPKELLCEALTGRRVADKFSWRGLANLSTSQYSAVFLDFLGIDARSLPPIIPPWGEAGKTAGNPLGLPDGIPVFAGCNDFFAGLAGMGAREGELFDVTGTSEHLGVISAAPRFDTGLVCGPYFEGFAAYGGTASTGATIDFWRGNFPMDADMARLHGKRPPIFLPYLNGERAPVWDAAARGVFFGVEADCTAADLAYSTFEGVAFALYHIFEGLGETGARALRVSGGGAANSQMNRLKAELFGLPALLVEESDASALGAVMFAAVGAGRFKGLRDAAEAMVKISETVRPEGRYRARLLQRFEIYKALYPPLKEQFVKFGRLEK